MWIDVIDSRGKVIPLQTVLDRVCDVYATAVADAVSYRAFEQFDFRHAVSIVDTNGRHCRRSPAIENLAWQLLAEYGEARGGRPIKDSLDVETWDFGTCVGYSLCFVGGPTEPTYGTRLIADPTIPGYTLKDREERYVLVEPREKEL